MSKVMSLAKNYDPKKTPFPAIAQIKYDGVPITFKKIGTHCIAVSRQSEVMKSADHIRELLNQVLEPGDEVTMECLVKGMAKFKDISGVIRRHTTDERIFGKIFDGAKARNHDLPYIDRYEWFREVANACMRLSPVSKPVQQAIGTRVNNEYEMLMYFDRMRKSYKETADKYPSLGITLEGIMLHDVDRPYTPGKRIWGMSRYKPQPTIDLEVVGYEEATSEAGEPLGMVGRVNVRLIRRWPVRAIPAGWRHLSDDGNTVSAQKIVGVGPGKLTHDERKELWHSYNTMQSTAYTSIIAEIKYMPDESYDALRQPTFQRFRPDKTEPDILEY